MILRACLGLCLALHLAVNSVIGPPFFPAPARIAAAPSIAPCAPPEMPAVRIGFPPRNTRVVQRL